MSKPKTLDWSEMTELLTAAQMRACEGAAMDTGVVTGLELMERAGRGVVAAVFAHWPDLQAGPHKAIVLCGPGNNGGDGFVVARILKDWGWQIEVFLYGDPEKLPPDAKTNHDRWRQLGPVGDVLSDFDTRDTWCDADLAVDALFGTGLTRPLEDLTQVLMNLEDAAQIYSDPDARRSPQFSAPRVVAIDIPSGLDADSGKTLVPSHHGPGAAAANLTVSFHALKLGHVLHRGPELCGTTVVADIGLGRDAPPEARQISDAARRVSAPSAADLQKQGLQHKYDNGHALILSGPMGRSGAARLAARGALRVGAGLVTVAAPGSAMMECAAQLTAIMLRRYDGAEGLMSLLEDARLNALCLGPGLGVGGDTRALVRAALSAKRAAVLDADALTSFADAPNALFAHTEGSDTVLTPHGGEFASLFPDLAADLEAPADQGPAFSKVDATRAAAARAGCTVLFKGADTVIATETGVCAVNAAVYDRAAPWLATAGSGDVLAGIVTGLLARGLAPFDAAQAAAWMHVEAARAFGPGLIAEDLPEMLPHALRAAGQD